MSLNDILFNWEACMCCNQLGWEEGGDYPVVYSSAKALKFNVDGALRGKQGPMWNCGALRNFKGEVMMIFQKPVEIQDPNEVEVLAIL